MIFCLHLIGASNDLATVTITFVPKTWRTKQKKNKNTQNIKLSSINKMTRCSHSTWDAVLTFLGTQLWSS